MFSDKEVQIIKSGGIGVIPTDTIYGIVASALNEEAVLGVYEIKNRDKEKPFIILISSFEDLKIFDIDKNFIEKIKEDNIWPGPVSVIVPCLSERFEYLHRGKKSLAFRMPNNKNLIEFLSKTGPLVAPSANPESLDPAEDINKAKEYFGENVNFYCDGGVLNASPSKIINYCGDHKEVLR